jgi:hypothetical protein
VEWALLPATSAFVPTFSCSVARPARAHSLYALDELFPGKLKEEFSLFACHRGCAFQEVVNGIAVLEVVE